MKERLRFTAVILTKNAQEKVRNCLESVKWADEVLVIDGFSSDDTVSISQEYGAKIVQREFEGFDKERNAGIEQAQGDWILQLDADDVVSAGMRTAIQGVLSGRQQYNAYKFIRQNFFFGKRLKFGGWHHYSAHFLRKGKARYQGRIHETLLVDGPIGVIEEIVEHHPFNSISEFIQRQNKYTGLQAERMLDEMGVLDQALIKNKLLKRPRKIFWKIYIKKQGYREGVLGFIFAILFAWVEFTKWAKYWELCNAKAGYAE